MPDELSAEADPRTIDDILMAGSAVPLPQPRPTDLPLGPPRRPMPEGGAGAQAMPVAPRQMFKPNDPAFNYDMLQREMLKRQEMTDMSEVEPWLSWQGYGENQVMPNPNLFHINPHTYSNSMNILELMPPRSDEDIERSFRMHKDYGKRI
jgi:hypothetical protein